MSEPFIPEDSRGESAAAAARPSVFAASALTLLAFVGLWLSELGLAFTGVREDASFLVICIVYYLPFMLLPASIYLLRQPEVRPSARLNPMPVMSTLAVVLLGLLSVYAASAVAAVWQLLTGALGLPVLGGTPEVESSRVLMTSVISMAAVPAVCEELLFRGLVMPAWERRGTCLGIFISAAMFTLMHGNVTGLPAYLLIGGISGYLVFATDSLYAGIVYHTVYNTACLVIPYLASKQAAVEAAESEALDAVSLLFAIQQMLMVGGLMMLLLLSIHRRARRENRRMVPRTRLPLAQRDWVMTLAAVLAMLAGVAVIAAASVWMGGTA